MGTDGEKRVTDIAQVNQAIDAISPTSVIPQTFDDVVAMTAKRVGKTLVEYAVCGESALTANPQNTSTCIENQLRTSPLSVAYPVAGGEIVAGVGYKDEHFNLLPEATPLGTGLYAGVRFTREC